MTRARAFSEEDKENWSSNVEYQVAEEVSCHEAIEFKRKIEALPITVSKFILKKPVTAQPKNEELAQTVKRVLQDLDQPAYYLKEDVLSKNSHIGKDVFIRLVEWVIDLTTTLNYKSDVAFVAVNFLSRGLQFVYINKPSHLEALALVCFAMAAKLDEADCVTTVEVMKYAGSRSVTKQEFILLEGKLMQALDYRLQYTSTLAYYFTLASSFDIDIRYNNLVWYMLELCMLTHHYYTLHPCVLAVVVIRYVVVSCMK